jgi:sterol desaturase/sphingolipid hydroxylase (fatty acid hydroxylase superfamily)
LFPTADAVHVTLASTLAIALVCRGTMRAANGHPVPMVLGLLLGFVAADVASGVLHWLCDTYLKPTTPLLGRMIIAPFREHHTDPAALGRHDWLERNGNNCLAALPLLLLAFWSFGPRRSTSAWHAVVSGCLTAASITLCLANQIHVWAHAEDAPRPVRWLQRAGVLIAPERHALHHMGSRACAYAVVSGWSNRWLDRAVSPAQALLSCLGMRPSEPGTGS